MNNLIDRLIAEGAIFTDSARELLEKELTPCPMHANQIGRALCEAHNDRNNLQTKLDTPQKEKAAWTPQQLWVGGEGGDV